MERENGVPEVAYIMSRFPVLTETFILYEMQALEQQGVKVRLCPLLREPADVMHPEALAWVEKAEYRPILSWGILLVKLQFLLREPVAYLGTLWSLLRGTWGSLNFFVGGLAIFPKTVHLAQSLSNAGVQHVHAHFANHPAAAAFIIHRLTGIPYSFTAHGSDLHVDRHMLREKVAEAACVVAISDYNKDLILSECGEQYRDKVMVIHCGVDTQVFQPRAARTREGRGRAARGRSPGAGPFTILCTGTLHEVKGQTYLINACQLLNERGMLVPPRDARALADALERLHDDPELRQRFGLAGRKKVTTAFDLGKNAATLTRHFTGLITPGSAGRLTEAL